MARVLKAASLPRSGVPECRVLLRAACSNHIALACASGPGLCVRPVPVRLEHFLRYTPYDEAASCASAWRPTSVAVGHAADCPHAAFAANPFFIFSLVHIPVARLRSLTRPMAAEMSMTILVGLN
mmetsp:Transcript_83361/g.166414  ORF Transcript_83361/g.166414 Transcript_83361/m.166414 type:complete len:125 (+) Transcript_83361:205-579(+)